MKTIELTNASPDIANLLDQARGDDIVVRMADGSGAGNRDAASY